MHSITASKKSSARATKLAAAARLAAIHEGLAEEVGALNAAIRAGAIVCLPTREENSNISLSAEGKRVVRARFGHDGLWVETANYGGHFTFGNDESWARLLRLAGVARDPRAV